MTAYIGYTNLVKSGTVTVTNEATGFEKENAQSWKTSTWWKASTDLEVHYNIDMGAATDVDCFGIIGDLKANSSNYRVQHSATGAFGGEETTVKATTTPTKDITIFEIFTSVSARYWRFSFNVGAVGTASHIGNLFLGEHLALERGQPSGFTPANLNREREIYNSMSQGGQFLGRAIRYSGSKIQINQQKITRTWIDANWDALANHIELYPFYFVWDEENYPAEAAYCIANKITYPKYSDTLNLDFNLDCVAIYDV